MILVGWVVGVLALMRGDGPFVRGVGGLAWLGLAFCGGGASEMRDVFFYLRRVGEHHSLPH